MRAQHALCSAIRILKDSCRRSAAARNQQNPCGQCSSNCNDAAIAYCLYVRSELKREKETMRNVFEDAKGSCNECGDSKPSRLQFSGATNDSPKH
jgi:hypothetical protein